MPTIKLVVIGSSGVGKTSLRSQYISGRFSNGYRATIGADFITKTVPHPNNPEESVILQIWDTAGQERFSSLSSAFYRGADAVLLMFDVNARHTMEGLTKWWTEFREKAPVSDEDLESYCCVVVGNKMDLVGTPKGSDRPVTEEEALRFLRELVPVEVEQTAQFPRPEEERGEDPLAASQATVRPSPPSPSSTDATKSPHPSTKSRTAPAPASSTEASRSTGIAIARPSPSSPSVSCSPKHHLFKSRSRSSSRFYAGTMTSTQTSLSIYHTPSSSVSDMFESARSSPEPWSTSSSLSLPSPLSETETENGELYPPSVRSRSNSSAATITPSLFARENGTSANTTATTPEERDPYEYADEPPEPVNSNTNAFPGFPPLPVAPIKGPKLFFTSAKSGDGVADVFEYVVQRVVRRWEYEEQLEARQLHFREASAAASAAELIRLRGVTGGGKSSFGQCCGS